MGQKLGTIVRQQGSQWSVIKTEFSRNVTATPYVVLCRERMDSLRSLKRSYITKMNYSIRGLVGTWSRISWKTSTKSVVAGNNIIGLMFFTIVKLFISHDVHSYIRVAMYASTSC